MGVKVQGTAVLRGGAPQAERAVPARDPEVTERRAVIFLVTPAGQVTVPACSPAVKPPVVKPPGTAGRSGPGWTSTRTPRPVTEQLRDYLFWRVATAADPPRPRSAPVKQDLAVRR